MNEKKKDEKKAAAGRKGGLVGGKVKSEAKAKAARINVAKAAAVGSRTKSPAKAAASRANGKAYGGRPVGIPITTEHARKAAAGRSASLTPERRREIAKLAVAAREAKRKKTSA